MINDFSKSFSCPRLSCIHYFSTPLNQPTSLWEFFFFSCGCVGLWCPLLNSVYFFFFSFHVFSFLKGFLIVSGDLRILLVYYYYIFKGIWRSVQFSRSVVSDSLRPHGPAIRQATISITNSWSLLKLMFDAIQLSHPLLSPSPPAFNLSQHQGLFQWVSTLHQVAQVLELQLQHQSF